MVDDIKQNPPNVDEEYKIPDEPGYTADEYQAPNLETAPASKLSLTSSSMRRILIPLGLIVAILIVYQVLGWITKHREVQTEKPIVAQEVTAPLQTTAVPATPIPAIPVAVAVSNNDISQQLDTVKSQLANNQVQLSKLADSLNENQAAISKLDQSLGSLGESINALSTNVNNFITAMQKPKVIKKIVTPKRIVYHIKAIIPGRAWLEDPTGQIVSVRVGDPINDGKVELISPKQGLIIISTGETIQYGANDL